MDSLKRKASNTRPQAGAKRLKEQADTRNTAEHRAFWMEEFGRTPKAWDRHEARRKQGDFDSGDSQDDSDVGSELDGPSSEDLAGLDPNDLGVEKQSNEEPSDSDEDSNDEFADFRQYRKEADEWALDDIRHAQRKGDRTYMVNRIVSASMDSQTQEAALKAALDKFNQAALPRIEAMASSRAYDKPARGAEKDLRIKAYKQNLSHIDVSTMMIDLDCNKIRAKIQKVLDAGVMKKGELCKAFACSAGLLNTFLKDGAWSSNSKVRVNAWDWFKQREIAGLKMPTGK